MSDCPSCGEPGGGDSSLAPDQFWCTTGSCRVVSFYGCGYACSH